MCDVVIAAKVSLRMIIEGPFSKVNFAFILVTFNASRVQMEYIVYRFFYIITR